VLVLAQKKLTIAAVLHFIRVWIEPRTAVAGGVVSVRGWVGVDDPVVGGGIVFVVLGGAVSLGLRARQRLGSGVAGTGCCGVLA
jgi:hypothetical protein